MCITLVGTLGMPTKSAVYYIREPEDRTKEYELRVKDVPCHAMWSITIYDAKGYFPSQKGQFENIALIDSGPTNGQNKSTLIFTPLYQYC